MNDMKVNSLKLLSQDIFKGKKLICIVGNGGVSAEDQKIIDKSDCVIRFNNYATRENINKTTNPFKCDVLFTTFDLHSNGCEPEHVVAGIPYPFNAERIIERFDVWYPHSTPWMVNPYWNLLMCKELSINSDGWKHPFPSIGFTCLWHLNRMALGNAFYICGFNWYFDWSTKLCQGHHFGKEKYPSNWNHCYPNEVKWITENMMDRININFSIECKKILNYAKACLTS